MALSWLTLLCLASTWMFASGFFFWPYVRRQGFYDDPCGPTLYRMRAQGVRDLPNSIFIPPPRNSNSRRRPSSQTAAPASSGNKTSSDVVVVPPPSETLPPRRPRPPPRRVQPTPRLATPAPKYPPYPQFRDPFNRPIDPWLALALDLDPLEYPDVTTLAPPAAEALEGTASARPRRVLRQAAPAPVDTPAAATIMPASVPARPTARRPGARVPPVECYCDSHWDCNGPARARGGRYDPQCDSGYGLVCCCR